MDPIIAAARSGLEAPNADDAPARYRRRFTFPGAEFLERFYKLQFFAAPLRQR
jgi:hypothetical protein